MAAAAPASEEVPAGEAGWRARAGEWRLHLLAPAALTLFLCFRAGGFFAGITGLTAAGLAVVLAVYLTAAPRPFAGVSAWGVVSAAGVGGLAGWVPLSGRLVGAAGGGGNGVRPA